MAITISTSGYISTIYISGSNQELQKKFWQKVKELKNNFINKHKKDSIAIIYDWEVAQPRGIDMGYNHNIYLMAIKPLKIKNYTAKLWLHPDYPSTFPAEITVTLKCKVIKKILYNAQKNPHIDGNLLSPEYYTLINKTKTYNKNITITAKVYTKNNIKIYIDSLKENDEEIVYINKQEIQKIIDKIILEKLQEYKSFSNYLKEVEKYCGYKLS